MRGTALMIGRKLRDRYELTEILGRGGMGIVYRAHDPMLQRDVAIKLIPPTSMAAEGRTRFRREARMVARLDHPSIVTIHDFGIHDDDVLFLVMPLLVGRTLRHHVQQWDLSVGDLLEIGYQVADALAYSHHHGVVHRDIKPENIMVSRPPGGIHVRVMDFGLAHIDDRSSETAAASRSTEELRLTGSGGFVGTISYMSPEQLSGRPVDNRSDLYSLGAVLYEVLSGEPPFGSGLHSAMYRIVHEPPMSLRSRGVDLSDDLDALVLSCLAKEPSQRPIDGRRIADQLQWIGNHLSAEKLRQTVILSTERRRRHTPASPPLVGRNQEMTALGERLEAAIHGECQMVLLAGEPGIGKSRLLEELEKLATVRGLRVLRGHFADSHTALPYHGLCDLIQDYFRRLSDPQQSGPAVDLSDLAPDLGRFFPMLSDLQALQQSGDSQYSGQHGNPSADDATTLARDWRATAIFEVLARTLSRLGDGRPLVLLLEHLHAGDASVEALTYIARRLGPTPTLIVGTYRPGEVDRAHPVERLRQNFHGDGRFLHLEIEPLPAAQFRQLLLSCAPEALSQGLVDRLFEATEGNPHFALELLRALAEAGELDEHTSSLWQFGGGIPAEALPATVQQVVERRLDRLPREQRQLLTVASVIGRSFEVGDLLHLLRYQGESISDGDLDDILDQLINDGLLQEGTRTRSDLLRFSRGIIADVLYRDLTRRRRRRLHRAHAGYLEERHRGRLQPVLPQLLRHCSAGDMADKTVSYGLQLARSSLAAFSFDDAIRAARTALDLVDEDEVAESAATRGELHWLLAQAERSSGHLERAQHEAQRAWRDAEDLQRLPWAAKVALFLADTAWQARQPKEARRWVEQGIDAARRSEHTALLRRLLTFGATLANLRGEVHIAQGYLEEVERLALADRTARPSTPSGGELSTALPVPLHSVQPGRLTTDEESEVASLLFETLLACDADGNLLRRLAEGWQSLDQARRFVFELRQGVYFSDGSPLTAEVVRRSFVEAMARRPDHPIAAFKALALRHGQPTIEVLDSHRIAFDLAAPLPMFPALLTDFNTAISKASEAPPAPSDEGSMAGLSGMDSLTAGHLGTGPFVIASETSETLHLAKNPHLRGPVSPHIDGLTFHLAKTSEWIRNGLQQHRLDIGRDLAPEDLEQVLRDPSFRGRRTETVRKNSYFVLWSMVGPSSRRSHLRRLASSVLHPQDLVWRSLGRAAQPAVSLLPPGILGHDAGRRRPLPNLEELQQDIAASGFEGLTLRCLVHPIIGERYRPLLDAIVERWRRLGLEVECHLPDMAGYRQAYRHGDDIDAILVRWNADYEDPDNFTYGLFHPQGGRFARFYDSPTGTRLLEEARQEPDSDRRIELYRRFEDHLESEHLVVPLFHDIDYRLAGPRVRGLNLGNTPPYVNYESLTLQPLADDDSKPLPKRRTLADKKELRIPIQGRLSRLDPLEGRFAESVEITPNIFETLTRIEEGARILPWLAERVESEAGGRRYRIHLRPQVRFHDGRHLTSRDVRYSFERALKSYPERLPFPLLPIRGARELRSGKADTLEGLHIISPSQLVLELVEPVAIFTTLLAFPSAAIVPEGCVTFDGSWKQGCLGTGPFRVVELSDDRLVLSRHPDYWRPELPRAERLTFCFGMSSEDAYNAFCKGRLSLVSDLYPQQVDALRRDANLAVSYHESPRLATYFLVLNTRHGPFRDPAVRRMFAASLNIEEALKGNVSGLAVPATGLIPPGLLGHEEVARRPGESRSRQTLSTLEASILPAFLGPYREFWDQLSQRLLHHGWDIESRTLEPGRALHREADLLAFRWVADYPDTDGFLGRLLHSEDGVLADYFQSKEIDRLLLEGRRETNPEVRHKLYHQVEQWIHREAMIIPLFHEQMVRFVAPGVGGFRFALHMPEVHYEELYLEPEVSPPSP